MPPQKNPRQGQLRGIPSPLSLCF
uniref:Uncharacterized protein n=1 Tax=Rhizophora mucronata TaxID=61149 RepID=A0A2P2P9A9_RHIMU